MKTIKSLPVLFFLLVSTAIFAQPPGGGQRGGQQGPPTIPGDEQIKEMVSNLADEIALSDVQETKVISLYKDHFEKVKQKTSGNKRPERQEMETLKTTLEKQVKAEMTKEQVSKYEAYLKKQRPQRK